MMAGKYEYLSIFQSKSEKCGSFRAVNNDKLMIDD